MVVENMRFSYSSVTSFITCPYGFKLSYIDYNDRSKNWYSDFGLLMHDVLEKHFKDELDIMELSQYYEEQYSIQVTSPAPPYPVGIAERYYDDGLNFFNNFDFNKSNYEIIHIENSIETTYNGVKLIVKPDIVLKDKTTGDTYLVDYKTSDPFKYPSQGKKKLEEYRKQMYLYAYFINHTTDIKINKIKLWFVRINKFDDFDYVEEEAGNVVNWFYNGVLNIQVEEEFPPCDTKKNKFFCQQLCSVSQFCQYKP